MRDKYARTPQTFRSVSGISIDASVIVTMHMLTRPPNVTIIGQVYSEPFAFTREKGTDAVNRALECLYDRHPSARNQIDEAFANLLANLHMEAKS